MLASWCLATGGFSSGTEKEGRMNLTLMSLTIKSEAGARGNVCLYVAGACRLRIWRPG